MLKYFKMYEKDKDNFLYEGKENGLFSGSVVSKMCGMEKSFLVSIARTQVRPYDPDRNTIVFALDYDEGVHTDSLILVSKFKRNRASEFIKVYLYDDAEAAKIQADYYQGYDRKEEKKKYYISMPLPMSYDYLHYEIDHNYIIIKDQVDKKLKKVNTKLAVITKDNNRVLEIEIDPIHVETIYNGITGNIIIYTTTDEEVAQYRSIKIFEVLDEAFNHETPTISNTKGPEVKLGDYMDYMSMVRPRSINDIWGPWTHKTHTDDKKIWNYEIKNYIPADVEATSKLYEEKKMSTMTIKDIKRNGPATIIFWLDGEKTVVQCRPGDQDDIEKGVIMAIVKGYCTRNKNLKNWTKIFDIPYADEVDIEKIIGLGVIKDLFGEKDCNWHYNYILKWVYKIKEYKFADEVKALLALGYSKDRVKKCLKTNLGAIRDALNPPKPKKKKTKNEVKEDLNTEAELGVKPTPQYEVPIDGIPLPNNELLIKLPKEAIVDGEYIDHINLPDGRKLKFVASDEQAKKVIEQSNLSGKIVNMFNNGIKISQIAKELNITEYFVKKALDEITKPKSNPRKAERILKKATKEKIVHKKHIRRTEIEYPDYLDKETCDMVLERTKEKYKDHEKIQYLSELQKYFIMECKREYIMTHYGNGYDMYTIAKVLGINAASVQRIWNACKSGKEQ